MNKPIFGFYHIALMNNWKHVVISQVNRLISSGLYDQTERIFIGVVGGQLDMDLPEKFEIVFQHEKLKLFEYPTLMYLHNFCLKNQSDFLLWYIHTKGVRYKLKTKKAVWKGKHREQMETYLIDNYKNCIKALNHYDLCGIALYKSKTHPEKENPRRIGGNFWWSKSDYIRKLPPITPRRDRFYAETWKLKGNGEFCNFKWLEEQQDANEKS